MGNFSSYLDLTTLFTKIGNKIKAVANAIPTKLSDLTADSTHRTVTDTEKSTWNGKSNFSGSYNDLTDKPTIPSAANNGTLTITQNGTSKGTFTANQSSNATIALTDTTYSSKAAASGGTDVSLVTTGEKYTWNNKGTSNLALGETSSTAYRGDRGKIAYDHSQTAHAPSNAQANQNAFSNVSVGSTTIAADTTTDTLTIVAGDNVTLTPDATNDKLTIAAKDTTYSAATTSAAGLMSASDKTKLDGIATGAEVNVQSDWNQTTTTADDYIKNKPSSMPASDVYSWAKASTKPSYTASEVGALPLSGGNMTGNISYTGTKATYPMIKFIDNTIDPCGNGISIGGGGLTIIGGGESSDVIAAQKASGGNEAMIIGNDSDVHIMSNLQDGYSYGKDFVFGANGNLTVPGTISEAGTALSSKYAAKTDIPTVNNGTLTIQKNGTNVATFTANQSGNATANITVPTTAADVNAAPATDVPFKFGVDSSGNYGYIKAGADTVTPFKTVGTRSGNITANGTYTASSDISKDGYSSVTVAVPNSVQTKTVTPGTSQMFVTPDSGYIGLSQVTINVANNQQKTVSPTVAAQIVKPDTGYWLNSVTVDGIPTQEKTVTSSRSDQTVTPDTGLYLTKVTVNGLAPSGTYTASSRGSALDMGATSNYRYVNTNSVPNSNSSKLTLSYSSSANYGNYDMGATNTNRYLDILDVTDHYYDVGQNDGYDEGYDDGYYNGYDYRAPVTLWTNPSPTAAFAAKTLTISGLKNYSYIAIVGRLSTTMPGYYCILGGFEPNKLGTTWTIGEPYNGSSYMGISSVNFSLLAHGTFGRMRWGYYNGNTQITISNACDLNCTSGSGSPAGKNNTWYIPEKIIGFK